jgi:hypothetical protein
MALFSIIDLKNRITTRFNANKARGFLHIQNRKSLILAGGSMPINHLAIGIPNVTPPPDFGGVYLKWEHDPGDLLFSEGFTHNPVPTSSPAFQFDHP